MKYTNLIILTAILNGCGQKKMPDDHQNKIVVENIVTLSEEQSKMAKITTGSISEIPLSKIIKVNGIIDVPPQNLTSVSVPFGGYLKYTKLLPGMHLKKGEVIAILEDQQYIQLQQDYLTTKTKLEMNEAEFGRQKELNESKAGSDKSFQVAKSDFFSQKIALKALGEKLKLININPLTLSEQNLSKEIRLYAPFDGFVSKVNANLGKYINPSDVLFELVNPSDIHLNLKVFEKDLIELAIGQKMSAYTNSNPEKKYKCEIILISKDISDNRTAEVHCHFEQFDKNLLPGMYMNAEINIAGKHALAVPDKAIVPFGGKNFVFVAKEKNIFEMVEVSSGMQEKGWTELVGGETLRDKKIVIDGAYSLLMSLKNKSEE